MATRIPAASRNAAVDAIAALANGGTIEVRTGSQPATASDAATGTLLATFTLSATAYGAGASGVATLAGTPISTTWSASGTAGWYRVKGAGGSTVQDGAAGVAGSGAELILSSTAATSGAPVDLTSHTLTMPAG